MVKLLHACITSCLPCVSSDKRGNSIMIFAVRLSVCQVVL